MAGLIIALVVVLGGGATIAASDNARPGDALYGVDLAVEKLELNLARSEEKKAELMAKFNMEREDELKSETKGSANVRDTDLSAANVTEIEVDVFTNETTVKIEAGDRHYGFVTNKKVRSEIVAEIAAKYELDEAEVNSIMSFEVEDRQSRADDREFLNSSNSVDVKSNVNVNGSSGSSNAGVNINAGINLGGSGGGNSGNSGSGNGY